MTDEPKPHEALLAIETALHAAQEVWHQRDKTDQATAHTLRNVTAALGLTLSLLARQAIDAHTRSIVVRLRAQVARIAQQLDDAFPRGV